MYMIGVNPRHCRFDTMYLCLLVAVFLLSICAQGAILPQRQRFGKNEGVSPMTFPSLSSQSARINAYLHGLQEMGRLHVADFDPYFEERTVQQYDGPGSNLSKILPGSPKDILAKQYALYSAAAYCRTKRLLAWDCGYRCPGPSENVNIVHYFDTPDTSTSGYIAVNRHDKVIVVVFMGSLYLRHWIYNLMAYHTNYAFPFRDNDPNKERFKGAAVHHGFMAMYLSAAQDIIHVVMEQLAMNPEYQVVCTGHSLGGALSVLAALDITAHMRHDKDMRHHDIHVYTYGEPRIGNKVFADFVRSQPLVLLRVTHYDDVVPHLPPRFVGFHHHTNEAWISHDDSVVYVCDQSGEDPRCSASLLSGLNPFSHMTVWNVTFGPWC